jgi:hypothetical protein
MLRKATELNERVLQLRVLFTFRARVWSHARYFNLSGSFAEDVEVRRYVKLPPVVVWAWIVRVHVRIPVRVVVI